MFSIIPKKHLPAEIRLLTSGALFGRWGTPIEFEFTSDVVKEPFVFSLDVLKGEKLTYEERAIEGTELRNTITVASDTTPSFSKGRCLVVYLERHNIQLTFSFAIHPYPDAEFFTFVFEFYEEPYVASQAESKEAVV